MDDVPVWPEHRFHTSDQGTAIETRVAGKLVRLGVHDFGAKAERVLVGMVQRREDPQ